MEAGKKWTLARPACHFHRMDTDEANMQNLVTNGHPMTETQEEGPLIGGPRIKESDEAEIRTPSILGRESGAQGVSAANLLTPPQHTDKHALNRATQSC